MFDIDTNGDGKNSLEESQAMLGHRGVQYHVQGSMSYGFSPPPGTVGPESHLAAQHYMYGKYDDPRIPPVYDVRAQ